MTLLPSHPEEGHAPGCPVARGIQFGLTLSSEEHDPVRLMDLGVMAEGAGFDFVSISDHFHPWVDAQGHAPFVWSVLGALAARTQTIDLAVGVTCPIMRIHPAVVAHAAATVAVLAPDRFTLGLGSGEALNEHVTGQRWPPAGVRLDMLAEAVDVIRALWDGEMVTHHGPHFTVENARLYDIPIHASPIVVSAFGEAAAQVAADCGDGLWTHRSSNNVVDAFGAAGGSGPVYAQLTLCWAADREDAIETAHRHWPNAGIPGQLSQDLATPKLFEEAATMVTRDTIAAAMPCGPDPAPVLAAVDAAVRGGITHLYFHQIGDDQEGFVSFWRDELESAVRSRWSSAAGAVPAS